MKTTPKMVLTLLAASSLFGQDTQKQSGIRAFLDIAAVLRSPRCINCHVPSDYPLQGDDSHVHIMRVTRGSDGKGGNPVMRCANCHQEANVPTPHGPPGAPGWRMPSADTPLIWQGLTIGQICQAVKDQKTNGNFSPERLVEHAATDHFILWAWNPGPGRLPPPLSHEVFVQRVKEWVSAGLPCPE